MMKKGLTKNGWDVMCNVSHIGIDLIGREGFLHLPEMNVPDMESTINCFTSVDPECRCIYTWVGGKPDTVYERYDGEWKARQWQTELEPA